MPMPTPQQAAANWASGLQNATAKIKAGVQAVTVAPTQKAAQAVDRQVLGVQRAAQEGRTQAALMAVSLQDWQQAMINKGVGRIASGATAAQPKMQAFMSQWLPFLATLKAQIDAMPRGDLETNIARATAQMRGAAAFRYARS